MLQEHNLNTGTITELPVPSSTQDYRLDVSVEQKLIELQIPYHPGETLSRAIRNHAKQLLGLTPDDKLTKEAKLKADVLFAQVRDCTFQAVKSAADHGWTFTTTKVNADNSFQVKVSPPTQAKVKAARKSFRELVVLAIDQGEDPKHVLMNAGYDLAEIAKQMKSKKSA